MPATIADLRAKVGVDGADKSKSDLKGVLGSVKDLKSGFETGLGAVTGFLTGFVGFKIATDAIGFLKDQMVDLIQVGMDDQKIQAQTAAVIKSTGGAAHMSASQISELADQLAQMSGISNDSIQSSENLLLTFRSIGKDVFPVATKAILDMSVAMHEDLQSATIQVGKALQDPIHGVTTLQRVGVQLNDSQKELIKTYMKHGEVAKAQGVILQELQKEFQGSADAAGKTLPGQLAILNEKWDEAKQKIAAAVIPILQQLVTQYIMPLADWLAKFLPKAIQVTVDFLNTQLVPAIKAVMNSPVVKTLESWGQAIADKVNPKLSDLKTHSHNAKGGVDEVRTALHLAGVEADDPNFKTHVHKATDELDRMVKKISVGSANTAVIPALDAYDDRLMRTQKAQKQANQTTHDSIPVLSGLGDAFGHLWGKIQEAGAAIGDFASGVQQRLGPAIPAIKRLLGAIGNDFTIFGQGVQMTWDGLWGALTAPVQFALHAIEGVVLAGLDLLSGNFVKANKDIQKALNNMMGDVVQFGAGVLSFLGGLALSILGFILWPFLEGLRQVGLPIDKLKEGIIFSLQHLDITLKAIGMGWILDLISGIQSMIGGAQQAIINLMNAIQQTINDHMPHWGNFNPFGHASGGMVRQGGELTWVGERGPELMLLPGGTRVYDHQTSMTLANSGSGGNGGGNGRSGMGVGGGVPYQITVYGADANSAMDIARKVTRQLDWKAALHG